MAVSNGGGELVASKSTHVSSFLLASVDESFFHYEPCKAAFNRIMSVAKKRSRITSFDDLLEDPALNEEFREVLREYDKGPIKSQEKAEELLKNLSDYRKTRSLYYMAKHILDTLKAPEVDVDTLLDDVTDKLTKARTTEIAAQMILTIGQDANALGLAEESIDAEDANLLQTGFKEFDERNGGLPSEGVMLLAATTSGGKSVTRMNLVKNLFKLNKVSAATVSLEMNAKKETRRFLSSITGIPFWKFTKKKLTPKERKQCRVAWKKFHKFGVANNCKYSLLCPTQSLSMSQLLLLLKPYKYKVIAIDYLGLLAGTDGKDQWQALSEITKQAKIFSNEEHCLIILLAQLDSEDDRIRYSKGILEHCVTGDTLVSTPTGLRRIDSLVDDPAGESRQEVTKVVSEGKTQVSTHWLNNGRKAVKELNTRRGYDITATDDHQFKVLQPDLTIAWKPLSDIRKGDRIAMDTRTIWPTKNAVLPMPEYEPIHNLAKGRAYDWYKPEAFNKTMTIELAKVMGAILSDGYVSSKRERVGFISRDRETIEDYILNFEKVFGVNLKVDLNAESKFFVANSDLKWIAAFFRNIPGMGGGSRKKYIPECITSSSKDVLLACLKGMFDGDGGKGTDKVMYYTTSKVMAKQVHTLLLQLGIRSTLLKVSTHNSDFHKKYINKAIRYDVQICGNANLLKFYSEIGFTSVRKNLGAKKVTFTKTEAVPFLREALLKFKGTGGNLWSRVANCVNYVPESIAYSDAFLEHLKRMDPGLHKRLVSLRDSGYVWEEVASIRSRGVQQVYDITVPSTSSFITNGFVSHNCDNAWIWNYSKQEQRDLRKLPIQQKKARDQELFAFELDERFDVMSVFNPGDKTPPMVPSDGSAGHGHSGGSESEDDDPLSQTDVEYVVN